MRSCLCLALSFCLLSPQAFGADLCQSVTAQLRGQPDFISGERGLGQRVLENSDLFQQEREDESGIFDENFNSYRVAVTRKFHVPEIPIEADILWVEAAPSTPFFVFAGMSGTMRCQDFVLYKRGNPALKLGEPPQSSGASDRLCENSKGAFGLLSGTPTFVVHDWGTLDYSEQLYVTPVTFGGWESTCKIDARFEPQYRVAHTFTPTDGIAKEGFSALALEFTRLHALLGVQGSHLVGPPITIGAPISDDVATSLRSMAATSFRTDWIDTLPQFGSAEKVDGFFRGGEFHPLMFQGRPYLMQFSFGRGHHDFPLPRAFLIMFEARNGKLVPVASAEVDISRGKLSALN